MLFLKVAIFGCRTGVSACNAVVSRSTAVGVKFGLCLVSNSTPVCSRRVMILKMALPYLLCRHEHDRSNSVHSAHTVCSQDFVSRGVILQVPHDEWRTGQVLTCMALTLSTCVAQNRNQFVMHNLDQSVDACMDLHMLACLVSISACSTFFYIPVQTGAMLSTVDGRKCRTASAARVGKCTVGDV